MNLQRAARNLLLLAALLLATSAHGQRERQVPPAQDDDYGAKFFDQLRRIFGRFRDADLRRVFESAGPIPCSELVTDKGEWREVAFFNENRKLGDWYRTSLDEVKGDLAVYVFKGTCGGRRSAVQLTTKFPVTESVHAFQDGRISGKDIDVNVNAPVTASFDPASQAYAFDLPYLFRDTDQNGDRVYTLYPRRLSDRYATDVTNHWDCKAVNAEDVTYQFLICRTSLTGRYAAGRTEDHGFGSSAYSILSDGREASSTVTLSFGGTAEPAADTPKPRPPEPAPDNVRPAEARAWRPAATPARLTDVGQSEFRLRFKPEQWKGKIDKSFNIVDGVLTSSSLVPPRNKDYCAWKPTAPGQVNQLLEASTADSTVHTLEFRKQSPAVVSAVFEMQNDAGQSLGTLQCFFQQAQTPADITVGRWTSIVNSSLSLEVPAK